MSKNSGGGPMGDFPEEVEAGLMAKNVAFDKKLDTMGRRLRQEGVVQMHQRVAGDNARGNDDGSGMAVSFPARYIAAEPEKDTMQLAKAQYVATMSSGSG